MTGKFFLDWAIMAISLFNTILLLWLGLTVLLNAERRPLRWPSDPSPDTARGGRWGIWLAGVGLLMGGAFFVSHSAILGHGPVYTGRGVNFWWQVGWLPAVALPFAWYVLMLWYAGFWDTRQTRLHRRQRPWLALTSLLTCGLVGLLIFANLLPSFWQVAQLHLWTESSISVGGFPLLISIYPIHIVLCILLSLDALRRPGPSGRLMGDLARRRARPWLVGASVALLVVGLLVSTVMIWIALNAGVSSPRSFTDLMLGVAWFDLTIASLIAAAILLLGQAVVSYEVFTGKSLPRRGLFRHWRSAVILAAGYGTVVGWSLTVQLRPIYSLLLTTMLMVAFYALFSWRSYVERERYIEHLRPFVASQRLYERLLSPSAPPDVDAGIPFRALCEDVLGTSTAYLVALGPLAPLVGPPLAHPGDDPAALPPPAEIAGRCSSPQAMFVPLDPARHAGAAWAVPLWSERGLIGVLLLGEKRDGGLYTQEEIEIARATGERLIDARASAEMARRLMALQRHRLAQSQVLDQRTRRVLHDEILPTLHAGLLNLSEGSAGGEEGSGAMAILANAHRQIAALLREMPTASAPQVARLGLVGALRRVVDDELGGAFDDVTWEIGPRAEERSRSIPPLKAEVLFYAAREMIRNAARHGRGGAGEHRFSLRVGITWRDCLPGPEESGLEIVIQDNGVGLRSAADSEESGGQGLALHGTMMAVVGGTLEVESAPNAFTRVSLRLPQQIS